MAIRIHRFAAFLVSLVIISIAFLLFAISIVRYSLPPDYEELNCEFVGSNVEMLRNDYGVPHIIADSERDMYFMLGYAQAQDRLWQLDHLRRLAIGETAEIFGIEKINYDKFIRAFNLKEVAEQSWRVMSGESRSVLTSFTKGINFFIDKHKNKLPFEFDNLEYFPKPWNETDCIAIYKYISLQMSAGFRQDLVMGEIADKFGIEKANALIPQYPVDAPYVYEASPIVKAMVSDSAQSADSTQIPKLAMNNDFFDNFKTQINNIAGQSSAIGSNAWAVNRVKNNQRIAVMANDPHLALSNPAHWYQAKLTCSNYNLTGLMLAGTPMMLIGRNDHISWGIANAMGDDFDYYYEKIDTKNPNNYLSSDSSSKRFKFKMDSIKVKNQPSYVYYKRATLRSGVISDFHLDNAVAKKKSHVQKPMNNPKSYEFMERFCVTYKWTGDRPNDDISPIYYMLKAKNFESFRAASRRWHSPILNFVYADRAGNIGMLTAGSVPTRSANCNPNLPNPGWMASSEWTGYIDKNDMPYWLNPDKNFVFAANNKLNYTKPYFISNYWDNPSRAERLDTLLRDAFRYSARDAQIMQYDLFSPQAEKIVKRIIPILNSKYSQLSLTEKQALERLKKWDYIMLPDVPSSMIYNQLYSELLELTFKDDIGDKYFNMYLRLQSYASMRLMEVLNNPNDQFIKNYNNPAIQTLNDLYLQAFKNTVNKLQNNFQSNSVQDWKYGDKHFVELKHPFANDKFLSTAFTMEKFRVGGNGSTVNNLEYSYNSKSFEAIVGASCRFISDMSEPYIYTSVPGGISGQAYSSNYSDQLQLWIFGGYIKLPVSREPSEHFKKAVKITNTIQK